MRGTLTVLVLVAAAAVGLYFLTRSEPPPETAPVETVAPSTEADSGPASPATASGTDPDTAEAPPEGGARTTAPEPVGIEAEARQYVETLTEPTPQPVPVEKADHFVSEEQMLSLVPDDIIERVPVRALADDETLEPDTPITIVREVEQIESVTPEQLIAESGGDLDATVRVVVNPEPLDSGAEEGGEEPRSTPVGPEQRIARALGDAEVPAGVLVRPESSGAEAEEEGATPEKDPTKPVQLIAGAVGDPEVPARVQVRPGRLEAGVGEDSAQVAARPEPSGAGAGVSGETPEIAPTRPVQLIAGVGEAPEVPARVQVRPEPPGAGAGVSGETPEKVPTRPVRLIARPGVDAEAPTRVQAGTEPSGTDAAEDIEAPEKVPTRPVQLTAEPGVDAEAPARVQAGTEPSGTDAAVDVEAPEKVPTRPVRLIARTGGDSEAPARVVVRPEESRAETGGTVETPGNVLERPEQVGAEVVEDREASSGNTPAADTVERIEQITVRELLERMMAEPEQPISIVKTVRHFEVTTLGELLESEEDPDAFLSVITEPYRIEAATLADLLQRQKEEHPDSVFYIRTVRSTDEQGIWGIVQSGLVENFARGMAIRRGEQVETYSVRIPLEADEKRDDQSSSFLGVLIHDKTRQSFVYNFRENRMGRNPDRIYPGQEIVIINFQPEELIAIYKHFTGDRG